MLQARQALVKSVRNRVRERTVTPVNARSLHDTMDEVDYS